VVSHGWGLTGAFAEPEHEMEKVLFGADELSGLIWSASLVRPSKSTLDMEPKSVKKKFKTPAFAAGCDRSVIEKGAALLGWDLDTLIDKTLKAMQAGESDIAEKMKAL
jgi:predicted hydrolase (HD superfamily)